MELISKVVPYLYGHIGLTLLLILSSIQHDVMNALEMHRLTGMLVTAPHTFYMVLSQSGRDFVGLL